MAFTALPIFFFYSSRIVLFVALRRVASSCRAVDGVRWVRSCVCQAQPQNEAWAQLPNSEARHPRRRAAAHGLEWKLAKGLLMHGTGNQQPVV